MESIDNHKSASKVEEVTQLRTQLTELRTEFTTEKMILKTEVTDLRTEITDLGVKINKLRTDIKVRQNRLANFLEHIQQFFYVSVR